jgi:hypothetical protein
MPPLLLPPVRPMMDAAHFEQNPFLVFAFLRAMAHWVDSLYWAQQAPSAADEREEAAIE